MDSNDLVAAIRKAAAEAVNAGKPSDILYGTVTQESPLQIVVNQKMTLGIAQLILTRNVTDFETEVTISGDYGWNTQNKSGGSGEQSFESHNHDIVIQKKRIKIHNKLKSGEQVILIQAAGGQKFIVLDRIGETS